MRIPDFSLIPDSDGEGHGPFYDPDAEEEAALPRCKYCSQKYDPDHDDTNNGACGPCDEAAKDQEAGGF